MTDKRLLGSLEPWEWRDATRQIINNIKRLADAALPGSGHVIVLDDYQVANLRALINAIGYGTVNDPPIGRLSALNNGDWVGEIYQKLPYVEHKPNQTWQELRQAVNEKLTP